MRKTKIICTLGPSTDDPKVLEAMMKSGMDVARFNFSHGTHADHKKRLEQLKETRKRMNLPVAALLDTKGPEIRLKTFENGKEVLETGQTFTLTVRDVAGTGTSAPSATATCPRMSSPALRSCWTTASSA